MKKLLLHFISLLLIAAVFYFLFIAFKENWDKISDYTLHFNLWLLLFSSFVYSVSLGLLAGGWWIILSYLHYPISLGKTLLYFFITQPAKYIPGKIWIGVTRMKFCKPQGVPHPVTLLSSAIEAILEIFAGAYISTVTFLLYSESFKGVSNAVIFILTGLGILLLIPRIFYFCINLYLKIVKHAPIERHKHVSFYKLFFLQMLYIAGVFGIGFSHWLFLQSFISISPQYAFFIIGLGAFTYIMSIIAFFSPSGLGVKEGIWYLSLKTIIEGHLALIFSVVSRLWNMIVEGFLLMLCLPILWMTASLDKKSKGNGKNG